MELKIELSNGGFGAERFVALLFALTTLGPLTGDSSFNTICYLPKYSFHDLTLILLSRTSLMAFTAARAPATVVM